MAISKFPEATFRSVDFTSSGNWICPIGVYSAEFLVVGAGGGGGGADNSVNTRSSGGGGGGGGAVKKITLPTTPGSTYTVTVGAKGTGGLATAGTNGGYSEVSLGASVLIRAYGGAGGGGIDAADATILPTGSGTVAGGGGEPKSHTAANIAAGGGGGAFGAINFGSTSTTELLFSQYSNQWPYGLDGSSGKKGFASSTTNIQTTGGMGIDGFGCGGGGSWTGSSGQYGEPLSRAPYGAGDGAFRTSNGQTDGSAALANTGSGGGGAICRASTTGVSGGNGSDGIVRITYFA